MIWTGQIIPFPVRLPRAYRTESLFHLDIFFEVAEQTIEISFGDTIALPRSFLLATVPTECQKWDMIPLVDASVCEGTLSIWVLSKASTNNADHPSGYL